MNPLRCLLISVALLLLTQAQAEPQTFYIAPPPVGDDTHEGSERAPFATLDQARLAVRAYLAAHNLDRDLVVEFRAGTYELPAPVRFESTDSGKDGFSVVYRAETNASVVLSGGRRIAEWTPEAKGDYRAAIGADVDFRQLWVNGRRAIRARTPNAGQMFTLESEKQADGFDLRTAQLAGVKLRPNEVEISILIAWMHKRLRITRTAEATHSAFTRAVIAEPEWDAVTKQPQGDRVYLGRDYWLENAREFLDSPGEFYLDRVERIVRYRPRADENGTSLQAIRPELENLIILAGQLDAPVHHLRFEGLTFAHTNWTRPNRVGFVDVQANSLIPAAPEQAVDPQYRHNQRKDRVPAAFQAATADHVSVLGCHFVHLGGTGVMFVQGGNDNVIEGNSFFDLAAGGIELGEDAPQPTNPRLFPRRNRLANNFLGLIGQDYFGSVAILGYYTDSSVVTHNEIAAIPYTAISQGWGWDKPRSPEEARANRITHNRVTNYMRRLDDGGCIYTTGHQVGSEIAGNYVAGMRPPKPDTKAGGALYPDQCTEGFDIHDNVVVDAVRWLNIWNPNIRGNRVTSNYANTAAQRNDGTDNVVEPVQMLTETPWPEPALAILNTAGLERRFAETLDLAASSEVIVESHDLELSLLAGSWTTTEGASGGYGATCRRSTDPQAKAQWEPILPKSGRYAVSVWQPRGSGAARFQVRHTGGVTEISIPAAAESGWFELGEFTLPAGARTVIEVQPERGKASGPLTVDALRCRWIGAR